MAIKKEEHYFYAHDGKQLKSMSEMLEWIKESSDESFNHHINSERNDFSVWAKEVLKKPTLSKKLKKNQSREEAIEIIKEALNEKNKKRNKKTKIISQIKGAIYNE